MLDLYMQVLFLVVLYSFNTPLFDLFNLTFRSYFSYPYIRLHVIYSGVLGNYHLIVGILNDRVSNFVWVSFCPEILLLDWLVFAWLFFIKLLLCKFMIFVSRKIFKASIQECKYGEVNNKKIYVLNSLVSKLIPY